MIQVTDEAKVKLLALMKEEGKDSDAFVRVGVNSGGCSGLSYDLGFDTNENEDDKSFEDNGIKIVVNKKSYLYLIGTILEYSGGLNGKGFVWLSNQPLGLVDRSRCHGQRGLFNTGMGRQGHRAPSQNGTYNNRWRAR